jgi:5-methylcytosine-specific restriction endonuclease McrA
VRAAALLRDGYHCTRCGVLLLGQRFGVIVRNEDAEPAMENLLTACAPCRRCIVLHQDPEDRLNGLRLWPSQDPAATPLRRHGSDHPEWLGRNGHYSATPPE